MVLAPLLYSDQHLGSGVKQKARYICFLTEGQNNQSCEGDSRRNHVRLMLHQCRVTSNSINVSLRCVA